MYLESRNFLDITLNYNICKFELSMQICSINSYFGSYWMLSVDFSVPKLTFSD